MREVEDWTTLEIVEFLNSYNRVFDNRPNITEVYGELYIEAFAELLNRNTLLALLY